MTEQHNHPDDARRRSGGERVRREVLGDLHVDRSLLHRSEFSLPVQQYVTQACWGDLWTRPGLPRQTRSLLTLVMLTALNHPTELASHVRGALRNGCTEGEIQETLLHTAAYCGVPAALEAFRVAEQALADFRTEARTSATAQCDD